MPNPLIDYDNGYIKVSGCRDSLLRDIPSMTRKPNYISLAGTPVVATQVLNRLNGADRTREFSAWLAIVSLSDKIGVFDRLAMATVPPLWPRQIAAVEHILKHPTTALDYWMGSGKSRIIVTSIALMQLRMTLIVAPINAVENVWADQFKNIGMISSVLS